MKLNFTKNTACALALIAAMGVGLSACGSTEQASNDTAVEAQTEKTTEAEEAQSEPMSKEDYFNAVENINTISGEYAQAMMQWAQSLAENKDAKAAAAGIEDIRAITNRYDEFTSIENPAEGFEEIHAELVESVKGLQGELNNYYDKMKSVLENGEQLTNEEQQQLSNNINEKVTELETAMTKAQELFDK